jgi:hypothetical protein
MGCGTVIAQVVLYILNDHSAFISWQYNPRNVRNNPHPGRYEPPAAVPWDLQMPLPSHIQYALRASSLGIQKLGLDTVPHFHLVQEVRNSGAKPPQKGHNLQGTAVPIIWSFLRLQI